MSDCPLCGGSGTYDLPWEEAFEKYGYGDGDGVVLTYEIVDFLKTKGYECDYSGGIHNVTIDEIKDGDGNVVFDVGDHDDVDAGNIRGLLPPDIVSLLDGQRGEVEDYVVKKWAVRVRATVDKTVVVSADDEDTAIDKAHLLFSVLSDGRPESYEQDTVSVREVEDGK